MRALSLLLLVSIIGCSATSPISLSGSSVPAGSDMAGASADMATAPQDLAMATGDMAFFNPNAKTSPRRT